MLFLVEKVRVLVPVRIFRRRSILLGIYSNQILAPSLTKSGHSDERLSGSRPLVAMTAEKEVSEVRWRKEGIVAMSSLEEFSGEIDSIVNTYKKSPLHRLMLRMALHWRRWQNRPLWFHGTEEEGEPVGDPIEVYHLRLYDMAEHAVCGELTNQVFLHGRRINAFSQISHEHVEGRRVGKTTIQPRWI